MENELVNVVQQIGLPSAMVVFFVWIAYRITQTVVHVLFDERNGVVVRIADKLLAFLDKQTILMDDLKTVLAKIAADQQQLLQTTSEGFDDIEHRLSDRFSDRRDSRNNPNFAG